MLDNLKFQNYLSTKSSEYPTEIKSKASTKSLESLDLPCQREELQKDSEFKSQFLLKEEHEIQKDKTKKLQKKGMKDIAFKFPLENSFTKVEIPFSFQQTKTDSLNDNRFHSYITIKETPKLYLDISDDQKIDKFLLGSKIEFLKASNLEKENKLQNIDNSIMSLKNDNDAMREEIEKLKDTLNNSNSTINNLNQTLNQINENLAQISSEISKKIAKKNHLYTFLKKKYDNIDKEFKGKSIEEKRKFLNEIKTEISYIQKEYLTGFKYYNIKFSINYYNKDYITQNLQKDLLTFRDIVHKKIMLIKPKVQVLIASIQDAVNKSIGDKYEVKLYGSHATNFCLPWSDIDVVLINKDNETHTDPHIPLYELFKYLNDKNDFSKEINFIGATSIPLIKIKLKEHFCISSLDISFQDGKHYGINCVDLINEFKEKYEALHPMILALKNILKEANLNNPYTGGLSSYGLVLLVVYFLKKTKEEGKSIEISNGNLGKLFFDFLSFYSMDFDPLNNIVDPKGIYDNDTTFNRDMFDVKNDLIIIDPLNPENNVAKNTRQFSNIRLAFMIGYLCGREECDCGCHYEVEKSFKRGDIEHCILKRIFDNVKRFN